MEHLRRRLELVVQEFLGALLHFGHRDRARGIAVTRPPQEAIAHALRGHAALAGFVVADLIGARRSDLHEVLAQRTQAGGGIQQAARLQVAGGAGVFARTGFQEELGGELALGDRARGRTAGGDALGVAGIEHHDDLVGHFAHTARALRDLVVGERLAVVGKQAFLAARVLFHPAGSVAREVDQHPAPFVDALPEGVERAQDAGLGGLCVAQHVDALIGDAHGPGDGARAVDVKGHAIERRDLRRPIVGDGDDQRAARGTLRPGGLRRAGPDRQAGEQAQGAERSGQGSRKPA